MKTKNKIVTGLLLSAFLLIALCVVGSADAVPSGTIISKNVSYSDSLHLLYAVETENFNEKNDSISMLFFAENEQNFSEDHALYETIDYFKQTVGGTSCFVFASQGIAARQIGDEVICRVKITHNGEIYYGDVEHYSVVDYLVERLETDSISVEQRELYLNLLSYGSSAQKVLNYRTDSLANNRYCSVNLYNGVFEDGQSFVFGKPGETYKVTAIAPSENMEFSHWQNSAGEILSTEESFFYTIIGSDVLIANYSCSTPVYHTVSLDFDNGTAGQQVQILHGENIASIAHPSKEGYTFIGWYFGDEKWSEIGYAVMQDVSLKAHWRINQYTLTLQNYYMDSDLVITQDYNTTLLISNPAYPGYTFGGYDVTIPARMPAGDLLIQCRWTKNSESKAYLDINHGNYSGATTLTFAIGEQYQLPKFKNKSYSSLIFAGWYDVATDCRVPDSGIWKYTEDVHLQARWSGGFEENGRIYYYYGKYPQTLVTDETLIQNLNEIAEVNENGYVEYDGEEYYSASMQQASMWLPAISHSGVAYVSGENYWYKVEPLKWEVIKVDNEKLVLSCCNVIAYTPYGDSDYGKSTLREFLNDDFYNLAFDESEKSGLLLTHIGNAEGQYGRYTWIDFTETDDYVYAPSYDDLMTIAAMHSRKKEVTDYALTFGDLVYDGTDYSCYYWARDQFLFGNTYHLFVKDDGYLEGFISPENLSAIGRCGVSPMISFSAKIPYFD